MDVLGHEDVAVDVEAMSLTALFEEVFETDAGRVVVQVGEATVAAEGEEVEMVFVLVSLQARRHASS